LLGDVQTQCFCCASAINNFYFHAAHPTLLPGMTMQRSLTNAFVAMVVAKRPVSLQVLWRFIKMMRGYNWGNWFYCERFGAFAIVKGCGPVTHCNKGQGPLWQEAIIAFHNIRGQLPLWQGAHCCTQSSCHPWQQFVISLFGKGLIVTLLDKCGLLGVLTICALGIVHTVFGALAVLALGNIHAFSNVIAEPKLGVFALFVVPWRNMAVIASCEWQHIIFDCCMGVTLVLPLHLSGIVIAPCNTTRNDCHVINVVVMLP
jgi:hypothetical protein